MLLDVAASDPDLVLQLPACGLESIAYGYVDILVRLFVIRHPADNDLTTFAPDVNHDVIDIALMLMLVRCLDRDSAADNVVTELLQLLRMLNHGSFYSGRCFEIVELYL